MYELKNGTMRLLKALDNIQCDNAKIKRLAELLNYYPEQLEQDIQALNDFVANSLNNETE